MTMSRGRPGYLDITHRERTWCIFVYTTKTNVTTQALWPYFYHFKIRLLRPKQKNYNKYFAEFSNTYVHAVGRAEKKKIKSSPGIWRFSFFNGTLTYFSHFWRMRRRRRRRVMMMKSSNNISHSKVYSLHAKFCVHFFLHLFLFFPTAKRSLY